jgi:hypothetical protein
MYSVPDFCIFGITLKEELDLFLSILFDVYTLSGLEEQSCTFAK